MGQASERRRCVRQPCRLPVELRPQGQAYPTQCETTDASPYGCYVTLMSTLPKDTVLDIVLWAGSTAFRMRGKVTTADVNVGNGIEFIEMSDEMRSELAAHLKKIDAPASDSGLIIR
jgi:hypothetical protein